MANQVDEFPASDSPPDNPVSGWMWFNTSNNTMYMYMDSIWYAINPTSRENHIQMRNPQTGPPMRRPGQSTVFTFPPEEKAKKEEKKSEEVVKPRKRKIRELMIT